MYCIRARASGACPEGYDQPPEILDRMVEWDWLACHPTTNSWDKSCMSWPGRLNLEYPMRGSLRSARNSSPGLAIWSKERIKGGNHTDAES